MKPLYLAIAASLAFTSFATAQESGKKLAQITFSSVDENEDGMLVFSEMTEMVSDIVVSMDVNNDRLVGRSEFMEWDFGFYYLAKERGQGDRYNVVKRAMFALHDLNNDGMIDPKEWRINTSWGFSRADLDNDLALSEDEYLGGWMPIIVMKAAFDG